MTASLVVIDTQSLLDWLVFEDRACVGWAAALGGGGWRWIYTAAMRDEFDHVLARGFGERRPVRPGAGQAEWAVYASEVAPREPGAAARLLCTDRDDQKFIDTAIAWGAAALITRDKALLRLRRRAAERSGVTICTPAGWNAVRDEQAPPALLSFPADRKRSSKRHVQEP